jgi:cholesterol oxidase
LYVPPKRFFGAPEWAGITDWASELAPYIDQASRMLGVVRVPYMPTDVDRYMQQVAIDMGKGESFNKTPAGVYYRSPGVEAEDPYFGGAGPRRTGCVGCGNCMIGCGRNAKNKLNTNYLYLARASVLRCTRSTRCISSPRWTGAGSKSAPAILPGRSGPRACITTGTPRSR